MLKKGCFLCINITIYSKNDYILKMQEKVLFEFYSKIIYIFDDN